MAEQKAKQYGRKYKSLLVIQYLLKHADEETPVSTIAIQKHLDKYGIDADRHSIYRDIYDFLDLINIEQNEDNEIDKRDRLNYNIAFGEVVKNVVMGVCIAIFIKVMQNEVSTQMIL